MNQTSIKIPKHVAIVMDGNGRWAEQRKLPRSEGHLAGIESAKEIITACAEKEINFLSLFAFSSENIFRPSDEIESLMQIFLTALADYTETLCKNNVFLRFIGNRTYFSKELQKGMKDAEERTKENKGLKLIVAMNYGGRWDLIQAVQSIILEISQLSSLPIINEEFLAKHLSTYDLPDPDLFIRTSGECRISNFYLWQLAYTELFFPNIYWPDFRKNELEEILIQYSKRKRRFGLTPQQSVQRNA